MISAADSRYDLPLYPRLQPASRHDSVSLIASSVEFKQRFTLGTVEKMLLDSAHDAEAIYHLMEHQNVEPFIDRSTKMWYVRVYAIMIVATLRLNPNTPCKTPNLINSFLARLDSLR